MTLKTLHRSDHCLMIYVEKRRHPVAVEGTICVDDVEQMFGEVLHSGITHYEMGGS